MYILPFYDVPCQATCSTDGKLRIYEASDVMNLSQWQIMVCAQNVTV